MFLENYSSWVFQNCRFAAQSSSAFDRAVLVINNMNRLRKYKDINTSIKNLFSEIHDFPYPPEIQEELEEINAHAGILSVFIREMEQGGRDKRMVFSQMRNYAEQLRSFLQKLKNKVASLQTQIPQEAETGSVIKDAPPIQQPVLAAKKPIDNRLLAPDVWYEFNSKFMPKIDDVIKNCDEAVQVQFINPNAIRQKIMGLYEKGISGLNWYDNFSSLLQTKLSPEETNRFCDIVAAVSPRMPVERNLKQAIQFYESALNKRPDFSSFMRSHIPNLRRAYLGEELQGPKVREFARALRGESDAVALDTWMAKAFGITDISLLVKQDVYDLLADALRELATEATSPDGKTVEPRQFQAAVWTGIKAEGPEHLTSEPIDKILKDMWAMFKTEGQTQAPKKTDLSLFNL